MKKLEGDGVQIINSAVFHSGFLIGGDYYDYKLVKPDTEENKSLYKWREDFFKLCNDFNIRPSEACVQFALIAPGVKSIALNTTNPNRIKENVAMAEATIPNEFWIALISNGLIDENYFDHLTISK
jgi:D-threo-aldose 1-dehydrogenase